MVNKPLNTTSFTITLENAGGSIFPQQLKKLTSGVKYDYRFLKRNLYAYRKGLNFSCIDLLSYHQGCSLSMLTG